MNRADATMNARDTVELVGRLCRPKVVVVCRQANRLAYAAFPRAVADVDEESSIRCINGVRHGPYLRKFNGKVRNEMFVDGRLVFSLYIRDYPSKVKFNNDTSKYSERGSLCVYSVIVGSIANRSVTCRMDLDTDFRIVSFASKDTPGLLTITPTSRI